MYVKYSRFLVDISNYIITMVSIFLTRQDTRACVDTMQLRGEVRSGNNNQSNDEEYKEETRKPAIARQSEKRFRSILVNGGSVSRRAYIDQIGYPVRPSWPEI